MCVGFEGILTEVTGSGLTRAGVLVVEGQRFDVGLGFAPEAEEGDRVIAHTGQVIRVVQSSSTKLIERA